MTASGGTPFDINPREKLPRIARNRTYLGIAAVLLVLVIAFLAYISWRYQQARLIIGPMVQARADGTLLVAWRTAGDSHTELVLNLSQNAAAEPGETSVISPQRAGQYYVAPLPNMVLNYRYPVYLVRSDFRLFFRSEGPWTLVQPPVDAPFRFAVFGETASEKQPRALATQILRANPHLVLHIGDLIDKPRVHAGDPLQLYREQFYQQYDILAQIMPFMPVISSSAPQLQAGVPIAPFFVLPDNGAPQMAPGTSYWFDYGTARFVAIDSAASGEALQQQVVPWLREVLGRAPTSWKFVLMHRSPYSGDASADQALQTTLVPVFEQLGVDVVFSAGQRLYARSQPLRAGRVVPPGEGIVYVTSGAASDELQHQEATVANAVVAYTEDRVRSFTIVELGDGHLQLRQLGEFGQLIDDWGFSKPIPAIQPAAPQPGAAE